MSVRFDDSLTTVLAADASTAFGAQSAWRQLVDLAGRGRVRDIDAALTRLRALRSEVTPAVRAASARALALAEPPAALVALFAEDEPGIAAPVLRTASLPAAEWLALLSRLTPAMRAVLRSRRDLPADVARGLESFGATDFVLAYDQVDPLAAVEKFAASPVPDAPLDTTPFIAVGDAARTIPVVAEALKQAAESAPRFEIAELVARIDEYQRNRQPPAPAPAEAETAHPDRFRFATDAAGVIRWVEGAARGPLVGVSLALAGRPQGAASLDATAGGALRKRSAFRGARLEIGGESLVAGDWRLAGEPCFDPGTGRFTGMSGVARRAERHESAPLGSAADQLRQLIHELRTPANAISGFAELIGSELLGPVAPVYRDRALVIHRQAGELLGAIEDLDTAARIEGHALELRPGDVDLAELVRRAADDLAPLAAERGAAMTIDAEPAIVHADDRAVERLVARLLATLLAAAGRGERLRVQVTRKSRNARLSVTRPRAFAAAAGDALLAIDADASTEGGPLLGAGFALRLARNLAMELGGRLEIEDHRLTLRLPLAQPVEVERATAE